MISDLLKTDYLDKDRVQIVIEALRMDPPEDHMTEEPFPGWIRIEREGEKPFYKSPFPRTVLRSAAMLRDYLSKEQAAGRKAEIEEAKFTFKRKHGVQKKLSTLPSPVIVRDDAPEAQDANSVDSKDVLGYRTVVQLLTRDPDKTTDHKKLLSNAAKQVDKFRPSNGNQTPSSFEQLKKKLCDASDMEDIVHCLTEDQQGILALRSSFSDMCLAEISQMDKNGPLVEFPPSVNENVYSKVVEYGMLACPQLITMAINLVVKKEDPVLPSDVLKIATLFSTMCYSTNHNINALVKLRSINLQMDGLTNRGMEMQHDCGLAQCSRSLSNHRDLFAEVGRDVMDNTAAGFPLQSMLDNCDLQQEHLTVEVIEKETIDTSHLSTLKKSKEEALALFCKEQVLLGAEQNKDELEHLRYVIGVETGKILAANRPKAAKLAKYLPVHHKHENSEVKPTPAITFILKPYPLQETKESCQN